ncbi:hypothetical protein FSS13T_25240 [Flavobacterium saliperosum S13]|uniref:Uncharacterized protein n=2 Tax=Flavobacterium saliperosum TaxID=329186 RepID=A0A1G4W9H0_9FLAO|nr:hypothetical protein [Flavobacterium saliperosum]ESU22911.1 hypothetical protein FSS13T_25240 [Flavobacterium saliperosum S13]SCX18951.1 hypothetical protein SAMN02927925_02758 [Flavobacterium saliperosum]
MTADVPVEKVYTLKNRDEQYSIKSTVFSPKQSLWNEPDWQTIKKATWIKPQLETHTHQDITLAVNSTISLKIPFANKELESVFLEGKYILELKDDWDDEGAIGYTEQSWKSAADFIVNYNKWLRGIFSGSLHLPKMHHGPKGTIDVVWNEDNFRLFVNIDYYNNKGTFYSDTPKKQYSEGEFLLDDFKFQMLPLPFKY